MSKDRAVVRLEKRKGTPNRPTRDYVFSPFIAEKDTEYLLELTDNLETEPAIKLFKFEDREQAKRWGYDLFKSTLQAAGYEGWKNGEALHKLLDEMPKRDMPLHSAIIHLSNLVVKALNSDGRLGVTLNQLRPTDIANVTEAIDRCMFVVFERGERPNADPINYLLSADISSKVFVSAMTAQKNFQKQQKDEVVDPNAGYAELLQATRKHHHAKWKRWKRGYGVMS